ncbi:polysaccharide pyruvyl transferase family protein [Prochlorococcus marinus]|uniref:polysaccharide pyruvyl transferase family protein n=1 Tax=Prochlorococcus marinus TaxID=1219 RepID=UPI001ADCD390|nr:polysaccharide pyruvyl transferase family protein [Prochlorococcus marinus]MBO8219576.1 polysaccharide pyruvyl transferase family protein [Prochlorococcus marinus CUG1416]MBW3051949.1 hypothetical protein [Prochlorococcus marinus str. MU1416]
MRKIYLTGHHTFKNRGCEAIVRSTIRLLKKHDSSLKFIVPSKNIKWDIEQWPAAKEYGVEFIKYKIPNYLKLVWRIQRLGNLSKYEIKYHYPKYLLNICENVDAFLSIGGDNYSLDYNIPNYVIYQDQLAHKLNKPLILWGASVGPFERKYFLIPKIKKHLSKMKMIYVREEISYKYLKEKIGLNNIKLSFDPAFTLLHEKSSEVDLLLREINKKNIIGINVNPLIEKFSNRKINLISIIKSFIKELKIKYDMEVVLVPHLCRKNDPYEDYQFLLRIQKECLKENISVYLVSNRLNAVEIKYLISNFKIFIGARTHSTIAALSLNIPSIILSYSIKSLGINKFFFENNYLVLDCNQINKDNLLIRVDNILENEKYYKDILNRKNKLIRDEMKISTLSLYDDFFN